MEILFLWIEDYGTIQEQGFNFGKAYRYRFDKERKTLTIKKNPHYIPNFFSLSPRLFAEQSEDAPATITNVTAIVGQNGAGKSTLLDFIKGHIVNQEKRKSRFLLVYRETDENNVASDRIYHDLTMTICINPKDEISEGGLYPIPPSENFTSNTSFFFFSNIFDDRTERNHKNKLINLSTNYLLKADKKKYSARYHDSRIGEVEFHKLAELERQIQFLRYEFLKPKKARNLPFEKFPSIIRLSHVNLDPQPNHIGYSKDLRKLVNFTNHYVAKIQRLQQPDSFDKKTKFKLNLYQTVLLHNVYEFADWLKQRSHLRTIVYELVRSLTSHGNLGLVPDSLAGEIFQLIKGYMRFLSNYLNDNTNVQEPNLRDFANQFIKSVETLDILDRLVTNNDLDQDELTIAYNPSQTDSDFQELLDVYKYSFFTTPYLHFRWELLSSGEKAWLSTFARFYEANETGLKSNIVILIDEGEAYLHPEWQKRFLFDFLHNIGEMYKATAGQSRRIQIIMTSNSPFVLSDLPHSNVIFLTKENGERSVVVKGLDDVHLTFAANIHSLLSHSFFMKTGMIGAFSKAKVNDLIFFLINAKWEDIAEHWPQLERMINLIGEPVLRNKLNRILEEKKESQEYSNSFYVKDLLRRVTKLEALLQDLEGPKK